MIKENSLYQRYFDSSDNPWVLVESMWNSSSARSYLKGAKAELEFTDRLKKLGWNVTKVEDQDTTKRYDFEISKSDKVFKIETKILMPNLCVDIGYRDYREVVLPSGNIWKTKARSMTENFDYLSLCLVNHEGYAIGDFICMSFDDMPKFVINQKKNKIFSEEDRNWIFENYFQQQIRLTGLDPIDARCVKLHDLLLRL